jgi:creatinine amidohydrolase
MLWTHLREEEFEPMLKRTKGVCAVAIGCVEKHGQHLPLGTDTLKGGKILEMAAEREEVCVFPHLFFGDLQGARAHKAGQGTHYGYIALHLPIPQSMLSEY